MGEWTAHYKDTLPHARRGERESGICGMQAAVMNFSTRTDINYTPTSIPEERTVQDEQGSM